MSSKHLFWDSCVFIRYLIGDETARHFDDISRYIDKAKHGKRIIYFSTLPSPKSAKSIFKPPSLAASRTFLRTWAQVSFRSSRTQTSLSRPANCVAPRVQIRAIQIRQRNGRYRRRTRYFSSPAFLCETCSAFRISRSKQRTKAKARVGRGAASRCSALSAGFQNRGERLMVSQVCSLVREAPMHPEPMLEGIVISGRFPKPE